MNWVVNYIGKQFPDAPVIDTDKGSLISESFSFWLKSPKQRCQITTLSIFLGAGNALAQVQRVHEPADLWDITFCTR